MENLDLPEETNKKGNKTFNKTYMDKIKMKKIIWKFSKGARISFYIIWEKEPQNEKETIVYLKNREIIWSS